MPKLSAFADEISPDLNEQLDVLEQCGLKYLDLRSMWRTNVMELTDDQLRRIKRALDDRGIRVAAVGSPIGKTTIDKPASLELDRIKRAVDIAEILGARYVRVFSFYGPEGKRITEFADEVINRMSAWVDWLQADGRDVVLTHENEKDIYGDIPERCEQLMENLYGPRMVQCFDPANWVAIGLEGIFDNCWLPLKKYVKFFHLKDYGPESHAVPCGQGQADVEKILVDAHNDGFDGFMTLEPHLGRWGQFSGFSGPDLFKKATDAVKDLCRRNDIPLE